MCQSLSLACQSGDTLAVKSLIDENANVNEPGPADNTTPLIIARHKGATECVRLLLDAGASFERPRISGEPPLWVAAEQGHTACVQLLIAAKSILAPPEAQAAGVGTPLHIACPKGRLDCVKELDAGADALHICPLRWTSRRAAAEGGPSVPSEVMSLIGEAEAEARREAEQLSASALYLAYHSCRRWLQRVPAAPRSKPSDGSLSEAPPHVPHTRTLEASQQSTRRREIVRRIKQTTCLMVMVLAYACGLSISTVCQEDVWSAPHYRGTYGLIVRLQTRLMLLLLLGNVFVHIIFVERSLYPLMGSLAIHTTVRLGLVLAYPGSPHALVEEWLAFMSWDVCGLSIVLVHACMGLFFGLGGGLLKKGRTEASHQGPTTATMGHGVAALRMMPPLALAVRAGSVEVMQRSLVTIVLPVLLSFWAARGVESFSKVLLRSLAVHSAAQEEKEKELVELRARCQELEAARRVELEEAHLRRLRAQCDMAAIASAPGGDCSLPASPWHDDPTPCVGAP